MKSVRFLLGLFIFALEPNGVEAMDHYAQHYSDGGASCVSSRQVKLGIDDCCQAMGDLWRHKEPAAADVAFFQAAHIKSIPGLIAALDGGAAVNFQEEVSGKSAFHVCAAWGDLQAVRILLERGANPFLVDRRGCTPMHIIADEWHFALALFIENCLNVEYAERVKTVLHPVRSYSLEHNSPDSDKTSLGEASLADSFDYRLFTAILKNDRFAIVRLLNTGNFDVDAQSPVFGVTPLMLASQIGWLEGVDILLGRRAQFFLEGNVDKTPLHIVARFGYTNIVKYLVATNKELPAEFNKLNKGGNPGYKSPVQLALEHGHFDVAAYLLANGFEFDYGAVDYCARSIMSFEDPSGTLQAFLRKHATDYAVSWGF